MTTMKAVKGIVQAGKIEPTESLDAPDGTEVVINVPVQQDPRKNKMITFGMFAGPPFATEEDFKAAEWHGEPEFWGEETPDDNPRH